MKKLLRILAALASLLAAGCSNVPHKPANNAAAKSPLCASVLNEGASCFALVRAKNWYSDTGIRVKPGQTYCFRIEPGQKWFDAGRPNTPPEGEPGSMLMNLFAHLKRERDVPWFGLMAGVADFGMEGIQASSAIDSRKLVGKAVYLAAPGAVLVAQGPGGLVMYPNDARGTTERTLAFYDNNSGEIWAGITRMRPGAKCPAVSP